MMQAVQIAFPAVHTIKTRDGVSEDITPNHIIDIKAYIQEKHDNKTHYDIIIEGKTPGEDLGATQSIIKPFIDAGVTWWIESNWTTTDFEILQKRVEEGPPKL